MSPTNYSREPDSPGISMFLWVAGGLALLASVLLVISGLSDNRAIDLYSGLAGILFSLIVIAIGSGVDRLHCIAWHLRQQTRRAAEAEAAATAKTEIPSVQDNADTTVE